MFKWIFLTQALLYLVIMPLLRSVYDIGYYPVIGAGILAIFGMVGGVLIFSSARDLAPAGIGMSDQERLRPHRYLVFALALLIVLYCVVVAYFGLFNRRQGSEYMAELYAGLPIYALAILRGYEILLIPVTLLYIFGASNNKIERRLMFMLIILSLPFTGAADSRSRILLMAMYILCFVNPALVVRFFKRSINIYLVTFVAVGSFLFYSSQRASSYSSLGDYLFVEVFQRLDGLNLVTDLRDSRVLSWFGHFDFNMFSPLLSKIPFLDAAREAKLLGRTSTKQYLLQDVLGRTNFDTPNSMVADPLFFAGAAGVLIAFAFVGYAIARHDAFIKSGFFMRHLNKTVISIAFVSSFAVIENDFFGTVTSFIQNYIVVGLFFYFGTAKARKVAGVPVLPAKDRAKTDEVAIV